MNDALVVLDAATLTYRRGSIQVEAVHGVTASIAAGESIALVGPSGSGKSSLLHLIAGLEVPTAGRVTWPGLGGRPRVDPRVVGVLMQTPNLIPDLDVRRNVALPLLLAGVDAPVADSQALASLAELGVFDLHSAFPDDLSGGQAQRVALARALAPEPKLLIADEPTGQLDHATAVRVSAVLGEHLARPDLTVVVSTHDETVADLFPGRWTVRDGRVELTRSGT